MKYADRYIHVLKLVTVISFLLIYAAGDKFGVFTFMMLMLYPFVIADGSTNLFSLDLPAPAIILVDFSYLLATYFFVIYIMRSAIRRKNDRSANMLTICGIIIFYIYPVKVLLTSDNSSFSIITIILFFLTSLATLGTILFTPKEKYQVLEN